MDEAYMVGNLCQYSVAVYALGLGNSIPNLPFHPQNEYPNGRVNNKT